MEVTRKEFDDLRRKTDKMDRCIIGLEASEKIASVHRTEVEMVLWKDPKKAVVPTVARIETKVDALIKNGKRSSGDSDRNSEAITFKWAAEKFGVPFLFLIAAIVLGIIFGTG